MNRTNGGGKLDGAGASAGGRRLRTGLEGSREHRRRELSDQRLIAHAVIRHAAGASQISSFDCPSPVNSGFANEGAILIVGGQPATAFVTDTNIDSSAGDGIVRGWTGELVDLLPTNTFTNVARCNQTYPKPSAGSCPDPAPCPK